MWEKVEGRKGRGREGIEHVEEGRREEREHVGEGKREEGGGGRRGGNMWEKVEGRKRKGEVREGTCERR
jgi:hypothetical protein